MNTDARSHLIFIPRMEYTQPSARRIGYKSVYDPFMFCIHTYARIYQRKSSYYIGVLW